MDRRLFLKRFCQLGLLTTPFSSKVLKAMQSSRELSDLDSDPRLVLIYDSSSRTSLGYQSLLRNAEPFLADRDPNWSQNLVLWDIRADKNKVLAFIDKYGSNTRSFQWPILVAVPDQREFEGEVEIWTEDWLRYKESRYVDACYPVSGGWWSVEGDWNPSITKVRNHLYRSPNHAGGKFESAWLDLLKFEELQSLHSDHHREMIKKGKVYWKKVNSECPPKRLGDLNGG